MNKVINQHYFETQYSRVQPVKKADKTRNGHMSRSFISVLKRQTKEDPITFVLTRLAIIILAFNMINQAIKY
jgi:hypothetical protein